MSNNRYLLENSYTSNYEAAKKFVENNNLLAAKEAFRKAALAAGDLIKITSGADAAKYRANATSIIQMMDQIDLKIQAAKEGPAIRADVGTNSKNAEPETPALSLEEALGQLAELEGLWALKRQVNDFIAEMQYKEIKASHSMPIKDKPHHMAFIGSAGTGKTTVARIMGQILRALGVVSKGQLIEVSRPDLVAGYVGQTAIKTKEYLEKARGGVLFIDEAYLLAEGGENDFGKEAINTLLKYTDGSVKDLVVIIAGYKKPIEKFIKTNSGLSSRFKHKLEFSDYDGKSLYNIFVRICKKNGYVLEEKADKYAKDFFQKLYETRDVASFGNAREVNNIFDAIEDRHGKRILAIGRGVNDSTLKTITKEDMLTLKEAHELSEMTRDRN